MPSITSPLRLARAAALPAVAAASIVAAPAAGADPTSTATPPPLTAVHGHAARGHGDIFLTPTDNNSPATYPNGAEIADRAGRPLWFHAAAPGTVDADFRPQLLHGRPVLTYWEGTNFGGLSDGTDYIDDARGRQLAAVHAGPGLTTDGHEFLISPRGTAYVLSYDTATADLSAIGGPSNQTVIDGIVQEVDIHSGRVLWSWNSADHVPYSESHQPLPASASMPWDWFHVNAVHFDTDGNLLIDARDTWTTYKVERHSGAIIWRLGGKSSSFTLKAAPGQTLNHAGAIFAWQHDPEALGHGEYTVFDNESAGAGNTGQGSTAELPYSRIVRIRLDPATRTATLVATDDQPSQGLASSQGDGQPLPGGGTFVGWGNLNEISQFGPRGRLVFDARFPAGVNTYRAYLLPWWH